MALPATTTREVEELERRAATGDAAANMKIAALARQNTGRKRIDDARAAALKLVDAVPASFEIGVISFVGCAAHTDLSPGKDRQAVASIVRALQPGGGTPIAAALRNARSLMLLSHSGGAMVVVTDGNESCRGDPCAEARELNRQLPDVRVHVIDVTGLSKLQCVAEATHGSIAVAKDSTSLARAISEAGKTIQADDCVGSD
jgi:Mg-chelatase subunit ChlD